MDSEEFKECGRWRAWVTGIGAMNRGLVHRVRR
jgi:hypothetical protein